MRKSRVQEFRDGALDIAPVLVAAFPIGLLWGTLAAGKGLSVLVSFLMSLLVFAGASQFVAVDVWATPAPWLFLTITVFLVNIRHIMMGASLSRHLGHIQPRWYPLVAFLMVDETWAFSERRVLKQPLTLAYFLGLALPMLLVWCVSSVLGAWFGKTLGDPAAYGIDFAFSALFICILSGFWRGPRTGLVLAASGLSAAAAKLLLPGVWYIVIGGLAGVALAALLYKEGDA